MATEKGLEGEGRCAVRGHGFRRQVSGWAWENLYVVGAGCCDIHLALFAFLAMCMGEPITFPSVVTDPNQLCPGQGNHMPSSRGEQTFVHGESFYKNKNIS